MARYHPYLRRASPSSPSLYPLPPGARRARLRCSSLVLPDGLPRCSSAPLLPGYSPTSSLSDGLLCPALLCPALSLQALLGERSSSDGAPLPGARRRASGTWSSALPSSPRPSYCPWCSDLIVHSVAISLCQSNNKTQGFQLLK
jgi:hypothetical protein